MSLLRSKDTYIIVSVIFIIMFLGSLIPFNFGFLNPFKKGVVDYEFTDLVFSKLKANVQFDDRILLLNTGKPDRKTIADCIQKLNTYQPAVIGVDIIFEGLKEPRVDSILSTVIASSSLIVLGDEFVPTKNQLLPNTCHPTFCNNGNTGYVNFVAKPNYSIRHFSPVEQINDQSINSFSLEIAKRFKLDAAVELINRDNEIEQIYYRGNTDSYAQMDAKTFLQNVSYKDVIENKIVLMGYMGDDEWSESSKDKFFTPLNQNITIKSMPDMYGLVIHANVISMILDGAFIDELEAWKSWLITFLFILFLVVCLRKIYSKFNPGYWKLVRIFQLLVLFTLFVISASLFYFAKIKLAPTVMIVAVALSWDMVKIYENVIIRKQKLFK